MEIPRGRGASKAQFFKEKYDAKLDFRGVREGGFKLKIFRSGVWIFSRTANCKKNRELFIKLQLAGGCLAVNWSSLDTCITNPAH